MASATENRASRSRTNTKKSTSRSTAGGSRKTTSKARGRKAARKSVDIAVKNEVMLIVIFAAAIFIFLCITGIIKGAAATGISNAMFGIFGLLAYLIPVFIFVGFAFGISNRGNTIAVVKMVSSVILFFLLGVLAYMLLKQEAMLKGGPLVQELFQTSSEHRAGGGVLFGSIAHGMYKLMGFGGTLFVVVVLGIICIVFITEKSFLSGVKKGSSYLIETAKEDAVRMREYRQSLRDEYDDDEYYEDDEDDDEYEAYETPARKEKAHSKRPKRVREEMPEPPKENVRRMDKRARGVVSSSAITLKAGMPQNTGRQDIHEIVLLDEEMGAAGAASFEEIKVRPYNEAVSPEAAASMYTEATYVDSGYAETEYVDSGYAEPAYAEAEYVDSGYAEPAYAETEYAEPAFSEMEYTGAEPLAVSAQDNSGQELYDDSAYNEELYAGEADGLNELDNDVNIETDSEMADYFIDNPGVSAERSFWDGFESAEYEAAEYDAEAINSMPEPVTEDTVLPHPVAEAHFIPEAESASERQSTANEAVAPSAMPEQAAANDSITPEPQEAAPKPYQFPSLELLKKGDGKKGDSANQLKETALHLQQTLQTFGVRVTITDISQGPSVTRYEMQPEQGVKVSKIVGLTDDIKLNLAATDIRIEAPIPGKAAVGIEVPNKETSAVALRDLLESDNFQNFSSNLAFAVGKDIGGQVVVTDIAKMPHVLIAGATGSGKSVCINTIIMSILYKANPADVKLIMIDPKVVELSVYNGIPHLMIPVVTDPKKASAALNWGVAEMNDRYKKFADLNVRDLKGYNKAAEMGKTSPDGEPLHKLPQIVIIVDELADLMMVASGEVEESICRLAQLARACGIHLVIATQRPSVDVITGLIKANMPSRIAFSVSSGVDSRTILDMNGAEKLLGKGDMLFYPQGYTKPARVQGAFVSDSEVSDVVDFLKNQMLGNVADCSDIEEKIKSLQSSAGASGSAGAGGGSEFDSYFAEAGKFVIEKEKASIGMLQRVFKIGFNRAARIVDQLEDAGVVGAEEGTKPRRILMSMEQFQNYIEEHL
ncbi:MAG: DNA translocase FtsK [Lachnospiraceae bacterium]|nr:DNA translocase FtsK [Lachnospiraceae bacterium]